MKQRKYTHDYFNDWRDSAVDKYGKYLWLQFNYRTDNLNSFIIVAEMNPHREKGIAWPVDIKLPLRVAHIDFRSSIPQFLDGKNTPKDLDPDHWEQIISDTSGITLNKKGSRSIFLTYEDYIRKSAFDGFSCLDIDAIECPGPNQQLIGIEGTHLFKQMYSKDEALRLFSFILRKRLFLNGAHQLATQKRAMDMIGGELYFLIYNTKADKLNTNGNALALKVDDNVIKYLSNRDERKILDIVQFGEFNKIYDGIISSA